MRKRMLGVSAALAIIAALAPIQAVSAAPATTDTFSCRASGLRVNTPILHSEPVVSNTPGNPCADDNDTLVTVSVPPLVSTGVVVTRTDLSPGGAQGARSDASVDNLLVNVVAVQIRATVISSTASVSCGPNGAVLSGSSRVAGLRINGVPISVIDQPITIPVAPLLVVAVNEKTVSGGVITQRALHIRSALLGIDIAVAESVADIHGSPCVPAPPAQCNDGADNDGDGVSDGNDPGCHSDGNAGNPGSYDPNDDDETNGPRPKQCSDTLDNDGDGVSDSRDPGCHTDGDPNNAGTYDPNDDDETNSDKECSDLLDNDNDKLWNSQDPGCHTDGNPNNPGSYDPNDDDESNA